jgi:predicted DNA-binding protein
MPKRLNVTNIRLDDELKADLRKLAEGQGRPMANYIVQMLREHVEALKAAGKFPKTK